MKKLIYHIGTYKTGSTSLQYFLINNHKHFENLGMGVFVPKEAYPNPLSQKPALRKLEGPDHTGAFLNRHIQLDDPTNYIKTFGEDGYNMSVNSDRINMAAFKNYFAKHDSVIVSKEGTYMMGLDFWIKFRQLMAELGISEVQFVLYIRRQDQYIDSYYRETVKPDFSALDMNGVFEKPKNDFDYYAAVSRLEQVFGEGCVILRRYGPDYLVNGDIRQDFCSALNIPWKSDFDIGKNKNPSYSYDLTEVKRIANLAPSYNSGVNFLRKDCDQCIPVTRDHPNEALFSSEDTRRLMALYADGNRILSERFFNGEPLFDEVEDDITAWERGTDRVLDVAVTVLTQELTRQKNWIDRLEKILMVPQLRKLKHRLKKFIP